MRTSASVWLTAVLMCTLTIQGAWGTTLYVDGNNPSPGAGGSWATARTTMTSPGAGNTLLVRGDYNYGSYTFPNVSGPSDSQRTIFQGVPGTNSGELPLLWKGVYLVMANFTNVGGAYPNTWCIPDSYQYGYYSTFEVAPTGTSLYDDDGWQRYTKQSSVANVEANPGSWRQDLGGYPTPADDQHIYIRTHDGSDPTSEIYSMIVGRSDFWQPGAGTCNMTISGFRMMNTREYGIRLLNLAPPTSNLTFSGNEFLRLGTHALVTLGKAENIVFCSNTVSYLSSAGVSINSLTTNCAVFGNTFRKITSQGISMGGADNGPVYGNTSYSNRFGIYLGGLDGADIYNNTCYQNTEYNMQVNAGVNCNIYNNTLYDGGTYGLWLAGSTVGQKVFNNISWEKDASDYAIWCDATAALNYSGDFNNFYASDGATFGYFGAVIADLDAWRTASSQDANSISADPGFRSTTAGSEDLHLGPNSPCRDSGAASFMAVAAATVDRDGDLRPIESGYDMGSDEFVPLGSLFIIQ